MIEASKRNIQLCIYPNENLELSTRIRNWLNTEYKWYEKVFERDDYTCTICGKRGSCVLHAHHTVPFNVIIQNLVKQYGEDIDMIKKSEEIRTLEYGITLCEECHRDLHWGD
jgi:5-methylcytosine-specific restriction endonuclease McrA